MNILANTLYFIFNDNIYKYLCFNKLLTFIQLIMKIGIVCISRFQNKFAIRCFIIIGMHELYRKTE